MPKTKRSFREWLYDHGVGLAYLFIMVLTMSIFVSVSLAIILLISWWGKHH